jgi:hypothetical protein
MHDLKFTATVAALGAAIAVPPEATYLGIPVGVLLAAFAGALFGLAYTPPEKWGALVSVPAGPALKRYGFIGLRACGMLFTLTSIAVVSAWSVATAPYLPLLSWAKGIPAIPAAGLLAFAGQHLIPRALNAAGRWMDNRGKTP